MKNYYAQEMLTDLRVGILQVEFEVLERLYLPDYKGSTLRGALASSLRQIMCATRQRSCQRCLLSAQFIYRNIFETTRDNQAVARPYVIEPPLTDKNVYEPGEKLPFNLLLIGPALDYVPYLIVTLQAMGKTASAAVGQDVSAASCHAQSVSPADAAYLYRRRKYCSSGQRTGDKTQDLLVDEFSPSQLELQFITPVRLTQGGRLQDEISCELLVRAILRRLHDLVPEASSEQNHTDLLAAAQEIEVTKQELQWYDWERYSSRQKSRMKLGGLLGTATLAGNLTPFMPLLRWGELLHVGKNTVFGLGQNRILTTAGLSR